MITTIALLVAVLALILAVAGSIGIARYQYHRGLVAGREEAWAQAVKAIEPPVYKPFECPHLWEPWGRAKWTLKRPGASVANPGGWARVQRRVCGSCGEEQERMV